MNVTAAVRAGRRRAESLMLDECVIRRKTGTVFNETTGQYEDTDIELYAGKCKVQEAGHAQGEEVAGMREAVVLRTELHLPFATDLGGVAVGDVAEVVDSADPLLVNRFLKIQQLHYGTHKTARRFPVEDVTA